MWFFFYSGANPNAQTTETEEMKVKAAERTQAREAAKKDARQKAIEKFQEIQSAKAAEKAKEAERQKKAQKLPSPQPKAAPPVSAITTNKMNSFEADLGHSTNPFDENDFSFSSEDGANPFLDDIRAASAAASALSFGGNPFEETTDIGKINDVPTSCLRKLTNLAPRIFPWEIGPGNEFERSRTNDQCLLAFCLMTVTSPVPDPSPSEASLVGESADPYTAETPTEDTINKLIEDYQLYQDPYLKAVIIDCHGRTPLHVAVSEKHEDVVNCFIDFQG